MDEACGWVEGVDPMDQFIKSLSTQEPEDITPRYVMSFTLMA